VYEQEIEDALRKRAGVRDVTVAISEIAGGGNGGDSGSERNLIRTRAHTRITAWLVKSENEDNQNGTFVEELLRGLKEDLPETMIPHKIVEVEELSRTADGAVNRTVLLRMLERAAADRGYVPPGTPAETQLTQVWEQTLNKKPIGIYDNFFSIGGDSLLATQLVARTNAEFEVDIPLRRLFEAPTIAQLAPIVIRLKERPEEEPQFPSSLVPLHIEERGDALFCIHPMGGTAVVYAPLVDLLPGISIYGIQSEGLAPSESIRHTTIESMAAYYVDLIRSVQKTGPYWLLGWSSGGLLALEAARILSRMGEKVNPVLLLDTVAPYISDEAVEDADLINALIGNQLAEVSAKGTEQTGEFRVEDLKRLQGDDRLAYVLEHLRSRALVPSDFSLDTVRRTLAVIKNNLKSARMYLPQEPYGGDIVLLAAQAVFRDNPNRWKEFVSGIIEVEPIAGRHTELMSDPVVTGVAAHIRRYMSRIKKETFS